jgi:hypothetical protein
MNLFKISLAVLTCFLITPIVGMEIVEKNKDERRQITRIARSRSLDSIHSKEYEKTQLLNELEQLKNEITRARTSELQKIPQAPAFKAKAKQATPPAPEQASFISRNKKMIAGLGAASLITAGIIWKIKQANAPRDYHSEMLYK